MLPSLAPVIAAARGLFRQFNGSVVPRPAFPAFGRLNLALFPAAFQPRNPRLDATIRFVGPMLDSDVRAADPLDLSGPEPVVYMSLGTLHTADASFYRACLAAFAQLPVRFVLSTGPDVDSLSLGTIPPNAIVRASVPQLAVLQHASVFITHGGMNSALEGLAAGVPLLVIPQHLEQLTIGLTVAERGAALVRREHVAGQAVERPRCDTTWRRCWPRRASGRLRRSCRRYCGPSAASVRPPTRSMPWRKAMCRAMTGACARHPGDAGRRGSDDR